MALNYWIRIKFAGYTKNDAIIIITTKTATATTNNYYRFVLYTIYALKFRQTFWLQSDFVDDHYV